MTDPVAIIGEAVAGRSATVRKTLQKLSLNIDKSLFDAAELLYECQSNNYYSEWGYTSLPDFAEKELGMKARRAQYLSRIVLVYRAVGLKREAVEKTHISKLREIARLKPEGSFFNKKEGKNEPLADHIVRLFLDADTLTLAQIKEEIAILLGQIGPDRRVIRSFSTTQSAWEGVFVPAMEKIRRRLGSEQRDDGGNAKEYSDGVVYEMMAAEINADPNFEEPNELPEEIAGLVAEPELPSENTEVKPMYLPKENI